MNDSNLVAERKNYCDYLVRAGKITNISRSVLCDRGYRQSDHSQALQLFREAKYGALNAFCKGVTKATVGEHTWQEEGYR